MFGGEERTFSGAEMILRGAYRRNRGASQMFGGEARTFSGAEMILRGAYRNNRSTTYYLIRGDLK